MVEAPLRKATQDHLPPRTEPRTHVARFACLGLTAKTVLHSQQNATDDSVQFAQIHSSSHPS